MSPSTDGEYASDFASLPNHLPDRFHTVLFVSDSVENILQLPSRRLFNLLRDVGFGVVEGGSGTESAEVLVLAGGSDSENVLIASQFENLKGVLTDAARCSPNENGRGCLWRADRGGVLGRYREAKVGEYCIKDSDEAVKSENGL